MLHRTVLLLLLSAAIVVAGCAGNDDLGPMQSPDGDPIVDEDFLTATMWDDGNAEMAFYHVERNHTQYEEGVSQSFMVGSYLVKHDYSVADQTKAVGEMDGEAAFKYSLFQEIDAGSYERKQNFVVNARQSDLRPFKESFTSYDWCSNIYRELAVDASGSASFMMRSDDYGNTDRTFNYQMGAYTPAQLPVVMRALAFDDNDEHVFHVMRDDGSFVRATATREATETVSLEHLEEEGERIAVEFEDAVPGLVTAMDVSEMTYWRSTTDDRTLLRVRGEDVEFEMSLVETLRTAYWEEDIWEQLEHVDSHP